MLVTNDAARGTDAGMPIGELSGAQGAKHQRPCMDIESQRERRGGRNRRRGTHVKQGGKGKKTDGDAAIGDAGSTRDQTAEESE